GKFVHPPGAQGAVDPLEEGVIGEPPGDGAIAQYPDHVLTVVIGRAERRRQGIRWWCARCHHNPTILWPRAAAPELEPGYGYSMRSARAGPKTTRWSSTGAGSPDQSRAASWPGCGGPCATGTPHTTWWSARAPAHHRGLPGTACPRP